MRRLYKKLLFAMLALVLVLALGLPALAAGATDETDAGSITSGMTVDDDAGSGTADTDSDGPDSSSTCEVGESTETDSPAPAESGAESSEAPAGPDSGTDEDSEIPLPEEGPEETELPETDEADEAQDATEAETGASASYGVVVDTSSIIVTTYDELRQALSEDNGYTTVYLGADITADSAGISIHVNKPYVIIDGSPPGGGRYTLTQYQIVNTASLIKVNSTSSATIAVTLRNLNVAGKNSYGIVWVVDGRQAFVTLTLENVDYSGPQPVYHRGGTVRFTGGSYTLTTGEIAEALHAEFGGTVSIEGPSSGSNSLLWLTSTSSTLRILENADVTINTKNYFIYGSFTSAVLEANASLSLTNKWLGFTYAGNTVGTFTMAQGSSFYLSLNTTESYAALRVSKLFEMAPGSSATIIRTGTAGIPLRLTAAGAKAVFNQPQRVFLYSSAGVPLRFTGAGTLSITTSALNVWSSTAWPMADGMDALPSHIWNKAGDELLTITGTYSETANQSLAHNLYSDDPVTTALTAANFNLEKNQLVAFGAHALDIDAMTRESVAVTGSTNAGAGLLAGYYLDNGQSGGLSGAADGDGRYSLPVLGGALREQSDVTVLSKWNGLLMRKITTLHDTDQHRLSFVSVPDIIGFGTISVPSVQSTASPVQSGLHITVQDSRLTPGTWRIDASVPSPMAADVGGAWQYLPGEVVFKTAAGDLLALNEQPRTVYSQSSGANGEFVLQMNDSEGVQLNVTPGPVYSDLQYTTTIHWQLVDAP